MTITKNADGKKGPKAVAKKDQPSAKTAFGTSDASLEDLIMKWVAEARSLGIPLKKEHLCKLCGFGHPNTKTYAAAFKKNSTKEKKLSVSKGLVELTPHGIKFLEGHGALPSSPANNDNAAKRIKTLLRKLELHQTGFEILDAVVKERSKLSKTELAKRVGKAPTTKSFAGSLVFLTSMAVLEKDSNGYSIANVYLPFPTN